MTCRKEFSLEELKQKPPPEGVDPSRLETYLSEADFEVRTAFLFQMHLQSVQPDCWKIKQAFIRVYELFNKKPEKISDTTTGLDCEWSPFRLPAFAFLAWVDFHARFRFFALLLSLRKTGDYS